MESNLKKQLEEDLESIDDARNQINLYIRYNYLSDSDVKEESIEEFEYFQKIFDNRDDCLKEYEFLNRLHTYIRNVLNETK